VLGVRLSLQRQQADLRPVTVADDELMVGDRGRERLAGATHVGPLVLRGQRFATGQEGIATEGNQYTHARNPKAEPGRPRLKSRQIASRPQNLRRRRGRAAA